jgi:hypothetical protein
VVVNAFVQIIQHGESVGGSKMDFCLLDRVDLRLCFKIVHGHDEPFKIGVIRGVLTKITPLHYALQHHHKAHPWFVEAYLKMPSTI